MVKILLANAGDIKDAGLIPGSGRSPGEEMATYSSIPAWKIPWTEEPGGVAKSQTGLKQLSMQTLPNSLVNSNHSWERLPSTS